MASKRMSDEAEQERALSEHRLASVARGVVRKLVSGKAQRQEDKSVAENLAVCLSTPAQISTTMPRRIE
jgi:hypothetical protein